MVLDGIKYLFTLLVVFCVYPQSFGQTLLEPFFLPNGMQFRAPEYPVPSALSDQINFPYYLGEGYWTPPGRGKQLYTKYGFPVGSSFSLTDSISDIKSGSFYQARVSSLSNKEHFKQLSEEKYFVSGDEVLKQTSLGGGDYKVKTSISFYQSTPVQNQNLDKDIEAKEVSECVECQKAFSEAQKSPVTVGNFRSDLIKDIVLKRGEVPQKAFLNSWKYYQEHQNEIKNKNYMAVVDYNLPSNKPRLFVIDLKTGSVEKHLVSHGINSSGTGDKSLYAVKYSNKYGSKQSSYGPFLTGETYKGKFGYSSKVDGQDEAVNGGARGRVIVIHPWNVEDTGRYKSAEDTWGCFGLDPEASKGVIDKTKNGGLWYVEPYGVG